MKEIKCILRRKTVAASSARDVRREDSEVVEKEVL